MKAKGTLLLLMFLANGLFGCDSLDTNQREPIIDNCFGIGVLFKDGGEAGMMKFVADNFHYPYQEQHISGKVIVSFVVDTFGNTKNIEVVKSLEKRIDEEVIRVVKLLTFEPARQKDKLIEVKMTLPLMFKLDDEDEK